MNSEYKILLQQIGALFYAEKYDEMLPFLDELQQIKPESAAVHIYFGFAYYFLNDKENALKYMQKAVEISPSSKLVKVALKIAEEMKNDTKLQTTINTKPKPGKTIRENP